MARSFALEVFGIDWVESRNDSAGKKRCRNEQNRGTQNANSRLPKKSKTTATRTDMNAGGNCVEGSPLS